MSKLGKEIIASLHGLLDDIEHDRPVRHDRVRRMKVKGKMVYARESFKAPLRRKGRDR